MADKLYRHVVLDTLADQRRIRRINFEYGSLRVYPQGLQDIADHIGAGRIRFRVSTSNHYDPTPARGETHYIGVRPSLAREENGEVYLDGVVDASMRRTIVHECTHALHDFQMISERDDYTVAPAQFEGAAYVAGSMAAQLWGYRPPAQYDPHFRYGEHHANEIARRLLAGEIVYRVPGDMVTLLDYKLASDGSTHGAGTDRPGRYVFNGL